MELQTIVCGRVRREARTVAQLLIVFHFLWNRKLCFRVRKIFPLDPVLNHLNTVNTVYVIKARFIILPFTSRSFK